MARELMQRLPGPGDRRPYRWTLRQDDNAHHHRVLQVGQSPYLMHLQWRESKKAPVHEVGFFLLNLKGLLAEGYIRGEPMGSPGPEVRVRVVMTGPGSFCLQVRNGDPALRLG